MWRLFLVMTLFGGLLRSTDAADQKFPYRATVISDKVEVRCGPGDRFYVTGHVKMKDVVTVNRHDHGGWFMIAPPKGSISWVDASLIKKLGGGRGVVQVAPQDGRPARAIVRIGSQVSNEHSYYGRELSNGDEVTILGEETLKMARGSVRMLKIVPPPQEFRWIKGEFLVPVDANVRQQIAQDPFQVPPTHRPSFISKKKEAEAAITKENEREIARRKMLYDELDRIDRVYAAMMQKEPAEWNLSSIEFEYQRLSKGADETISALIQKRMDVLKRRRDILSHYQKFIRVSAESAQRDQELVNMQLGTLSETIPTGVPVEGPQLPTEPGKTIGSAVTPRLNGAGIVKNVAGYPRFPRYALVAPDGRLLAYLEAAEGTRISDWIGKPTGIIGNRRFEPRLGKDVIRVQRAVPVKLVP